MMKLMIGLLLAIPLMACGAGEGTVAEESLGVVVTEDQTLAVVNQSIEPGSQSPVAAPPNVSRADDDLACWVVLNWCVPPPGQPLCTGTGSTCTPEFVLQVCIELYNETC
ncbi:hypothetical protein LY474_00815 [Myxococcus stipitatus]|uniref:hypothetical protein n=1 Tax=Myxococcus stipitatus TaxID=83455 RepID=UPI001F1CE0F8|nr:hypothetical protein [Myxococcus stipitatus]MCE9666338.1 hypothetical protein [Myxococcus stipitatus]